MQCSSGFSAGGGSCPHYPPTLPPWLRHWIYGNVRDFLMKLTRSTTTWWKSSGCKYGFAQISRRTHLQIGRRFICTLTMITHGFNNPHYTCNKIVTQRRTQNAFIAHKYKFLAVNMQWLRDPEQSWDQPPSILRSTSPRNRPNETKTISQNIAVFYIPLGRYVQMCRISGVKFTRPEPGRKGAEDAILTPPPPCSSTMSGLLSPLVKSVGFISFVSNVCTSIWSTSSISRSMRDSLSSSSLLTNSSSSM